MTARYVKSTPVVLKNNPEFSEAWLQDRIAEDPALLGLGEVAVLDRERRHRGAGRLDLLLWDEDANTRYELELMLGDLDESHIIRTLEYWDFERRRYPAYDHVAVIAAENVAARFLNVISLFSGSIPLIVLQVSAFRVGDAIGLNVVRVLDLRDLRDDDTESDVAEVDRNYWVARSNSELMGLVDRMLAMVNQVSAGSAYSLKYNRGYIGMHDGTRSRNFVHFGVKRRRVTLVAVVEDLEGFRERLEAAGLDAHVRRKSIRVRLDPAQFAEHQSLIKEVIESAAREYSQD